MISIHCKDCNSEISRNQVYLLSAGIPAECPYLYQVPDPSVDRIIQEMMIGSPLKHTLFVEGEAGWGKSSLLRKIRRDYLQHNHAVSFLATLGFRPYITSGQIISYLVLPSSKYKLSFALELAYDKRFLHRVSETVSNNRDHLYEISTALTEILGDLDHVPDDDFWGYHDWLRGLDFTKKYFNSQSDLFCRSYERGVGYTRSIDQIPIYKTLSFFCSLTYFLGLDGITFIIDNAEVIRGRNLDRFAEDFSAFWRTGYPFEYMKLHRKSRLNVILAGNSATRELLGVPDHLTLQLNSINSSLMKILEERILRCVSVSLNVSADSLRYQENGSRELDISKNQEKSPRSLATSMIRTIMKRDT